MDTKLLVNGTFPYVVGTFTFPNQTGGGTISIPLGTYLSSLQRRSSAWLYPLRWRLVVTLKMIAANNAGALIPGRAFCTALRRIVFNGSSHDIAMTGEGLRMHEAQHMGILPHEDPADIAGGAGSGVTREVVIDLPLYDDGMEDEWQFVDPVVRYVQNQQELAITTCPDTQFDGTMKLSLPDCSVRVECDMLKTQKMWIAAPFQWKYEDRTQNPLDLTMRGVVCSLDHMQDCPASGRGSLASLSAVVSYQMDPGEVCQPQTAKEAFIRTRECYEMKVPSPDDVVKAQYASVGASAFYALPIIGKCGAGPLSLARQPVVNGPLTLTILPGSQTNNRFYRRVVGRTEEKHYQEAANLFGSAGTVVRANPDGKQQPGQVEQTSRIILLPRAA